MPDTAGDAPQHTRGSQLLLMKEQLRRTPYVLLFIDGVIAWLLARSGASVAVLLGWIALSALCQFARATHLRGMPFDDADRFGRDLRIVDLWFFASGVTRVVPIAVAFGGTTREDDYLITIIMVGLAAGGLGTVAGMVRPYVLWGAPLVVSLMAGWISRGTFEGRWIALLLGLMFTMLTLNVRNFGDTLRQLGLQIDRANRERERAESEKARADEERLRAETAVLAKTRFFAAASHDLRQPLGVLRWYGDAIRVHARMLRNEELMNIGDGIGRALAHAEPLVGKYLDIARIEAGALEIELRAVPVVPLFEAVLQSFLRDAQAQGCQLRTTLNAPAEELVAIADESVLRSILDNLVGNALKFTKQGEVVMSAERVRVGAERFIRIAVQDTGIGIPAQEHERVFEDFYQIDNPDRNRTRGLGLGLAIVRRQASLLGTAVRVSSEPGRGSRFELELPCAAPSDPAAPRTTAALTDVAHASLNVLVIDDEAEVRAALRVLLEAVGWKVRTATGLAEALAELRSEPPVDALIVDYRLHGRENGPEVIDELRRAGCAAPAVIVTGDTSPEQLLLLRARGQPFLHKPVQGERLIETILDAYRGGPAT